MTCNTINIRVARDEKLVLVKLAKSEGKTLSAMLREVAIAEAYQVLGKPRLVEPVADTTERP